MVKKICYQCCKCHIVYLRLCRALSVTMLIIKVGLTTFSNGYIFVIDRCYMSFCNGYVFVIDCCYMSVCNGYVFVIDRC